MLGIELLSSGFKLYYFERSTNQEVVRLEKEDYFLIEDAEKNKGFLGFHDWLRLNERTIVGIRICFLSDSYNKILEKFNYVRMVENTKGRWAELLFTGDKYDFNISGDQDFSNTFVYKSINSNYLFTFPLDQLTEYERNSLLNISSKLYCNISE